MASSVNASNTGFGGILMTGDSSGQLQLQAVYCCDLLCE
jgi:hypothetical protein